MVAPNDTHGPVYRVTREFIGGLLKGLSHVESTRTRFELGREYHNPLGGSPYRIVAVERIDDAREGA